MLPAYAHKLGGLTQNAIGGHEAAVARGQASQRKRRETVRLKLISLGNTNPSEDDISNFIRAQMIQLCQRRQKKA